MTRHLYPGNEFPDRTAKEVRRSTDNRLPKGQSPQLKNQRATVQCETSIAHEVILGGMAGAAVVGVYLLLVFLARSL